MSKKAQAAENVKVLIRCRPLSEKELGNGHKSCVEMDMVSHSVAVKALVGEADRWTFDAVINNTFSQKDVFTQFILPLVDSVLEGFNATVFAYGQSGSGKTHTMTGVMGDAEMEGVIPRCFKYIFEQIQANQESSSRRYTMYVSFVELYNGKVRDLLAKQQVPLDVRESKDHTFFVQGAIVPQVKFPEEIIQLMEEGTDRRRTASTELNADSSRSHSLFTLVLECTETLEDGSARSVTSKLNLVDLAGSERQGKTGATGDTLKEGCNINLSLSALGTVIDSIVKGAKHIPFRSSGLTMLLKDSLGGNSKTVMFANINPSERNLSETVSTLRFADRAKQIKNKPVINMDSKDQRIAELTEIVDELREKLKKYETEGTAGLEHDVDALREQVGELEMNLDNAIKGREADAIDHETERARLTADRRDATRRITELEELVVQLRNDLQVAESTAEDRRIQREEVLQACAAFLERKEPIANVDELAALFKDFGHGANGAELSQLQTQVQTLRAENKALKRDLKAVRKDLEQQMLDAQSKTTKLEERAKKTQKELQAAQEALSANGVDPSSITAASEMSSMVDDYAKRQDELLAAIKLDDNGAAAMKVLREENEALRKKLSSQTAAAKVSGAGAAAGPSAAAAAAVTAELEDERKQREELEKTKQKLQADIQTLRDERTTAEARAAEAEATIQQVTSEFQRKLKDADASVDEVTRLETRLRERADQLDQMRSLLDKQKALIVKSNEKVDFFQQQLKEANAASEELEQRYRLKLEEKDASVQKAINKRLEQYAEERNRELDDKSHSNKKLKKKIQKLNEQVTQLEEEFDKKVIECEDLRNALGEQKVEQMRLARRLEVGDDDQIEVMEKKEQIQNALERAKEERKRKADLFAMGEVKNAKFQ